MSDIYCRSCGYVGEEVNGMCGCCGSIEIQQEFGDQDDDPEFDSYEESIEEADRERCEKWGHLWSESDGNGTLYCDRCGKTIEP